LILGGRTFTLAPSLELQIFRLPPPLLFSGIFFRFSVGLRLVLLQTGVV